MKLETEKQKQFAVKCQVQMQSKAKLNMVLEQALKSAEKKIVSRQN